MRTRGNGWLIISGRGYKAAIAALALCETLKIFAREPLAEQRRLNRLGLLAFDFSHTVSLYTANSVVLEIKGSLGLFGGMKKLLDCLDKGLKKFGGETIVGFAPTARAAQWFPGKYLKRLA